jgi:hypothetical protein
MGAGKAGLAVWAGRIATLLLPEHAGAS